MIRTLGLRVGLQKDRHGFTEHSQFRAARRLQDEKHLTSVCDVSMKPLDDCGIRFPGFCIIPAVHPTNPCTQIISGEVMHGRDRETGCDVLICEVDHSLRYHSGEFQRFNCTGHSFQSKRKILDIRVVFHRNEFGVVETGKYGKVLRHLRQGEGEVALALCTRPRMGIVGRDCARW